MRRVNLSLLGGFHARLEPGPVLTFRTKKAQALLAYLVLHPSGVHRRESLAAVFWGEMPDEQARGSLRHAVYELRRALAAAPGALRIEGDTVAVDPSVIDLDVATFMRLLGEDTREALEQAMTLYRGDLLAGLSVDEEPWETWVRDERERFREHAVEGLARLLAHQRKAGQPKAAIVTAHRLLSLDRLHEPVHRTLMRLHAQLGQRGAALRQYQECVNVLQRELGAEPEAETRQLYQEILRQRTVGGVTPGARNPNDQPVLPQARKAPETRPSDTPLVGRQDEMKQLRDALGRASVGNGGFFAVVGEAGIGKSRLVEELVAHGERQEARVLLGRAYESDQILLFGPIVDALRSGQVERDHDALDALGPLRRAELARLLPEIAPGDALRRPAQIDYRRLFEAIAALVAVLTRRDPLLLVLEDLHWADELTLRLLAFLARRAPTQRVLVVVTAREEELPDAPMSRRTLEDLAQAGQLVWLGLGPLSQRDTAALVAMLAPSGAAPRTEQLGERVWRASEGNPLVTVEMMREIQEHGLSEGPSLPRRAREVISRRIERLTERSRFLLTVAAVIGREFDFDLLRQACELDDDATAQGVEELVRRRLLTAVGERLGFTHERIREAAYSELQPWRRQRLHRRIAETIEALQTHRLSDFWEALADHWERGESWARAVHYHLCVAERAKQRFAYATAEAATRQAAEAATKSPEAGDRTRALELLGDVLSLRGDLESANESYEASLTVSTGEPDRRRIANKLHRRRLTTRNGARIVFYEHGTSEETLLFTNPIIYGLEILQPVLEQLCQEFRVITMDLRGTGRSDPMPDRYTTGDHAADIGAVIAAADRGPVTAMGISKSGNMLVRLAVTAPELVNRLVLIGTPLDTTPGSMSLVPSEMDDRFRAALRAGDLERAMHYFVATVVSDPDTGELAEQFTRNLLRLPRESILSTWTPDPELDIAPILGQVKVPTLVMHGTEDRRVSVAAARHLARHIPDAQLYLFEGRGHLPIFTATEEFCEILRRFVRGGEAR